MDRLSILCLQTIDQIQSFFCFKKSDTKLGLFPEQSKTFPENDKGEPHHLGEALPYCYLLNSSRNSIFRRRSIERIFRPL